MQTDIAARINAALCNRASSILRATLPQNCRRCHHRRHLRRVVAPRSEPSCAAPAAIVPAARAPLSSNYRSNGASRHGDPTPTSICRLALIQLPRRQLPRWYTCGRFIASVILVRLLSSSLSFSCRLSFFLFVAFSLIVSLVRSFGLFLYLSLYLSLLVVLFFLTAIIVLLFSVAADARSPFRVPRSLPITIRLR